MGGISKNFFVIMTPRDPISSAVLVSLIFFFPPSLQLPVVLFMALFLAEVVHIQQHTTRLQIDSIWACLKGEASHLIALAEAKKKKKKEGGWNRLSSNDR